MTSQDPAAHAARDLFETAVARLDTPAAQRLQRSRHLALDAANRTSAPRLGAVPAAAFGAAVLALGLAWWIPNRSAAPDHAAQAASQASVDVDAMVSEEDAELYALLGAAPVAVGDAEHDL